MALPGFILRRALQLIPTFAFILVVVFALVRLLPGDPASAILGDRALDKDVVRINSELGLDRPIPVQFALFVRNLAEGDLGTSIHLKVPVLDLVLQKLPVTLLLTGLAGLIALILIATVLGTYFGTRHLNTRRPTRVRVIKMPPVA